eukprot:jgi/Tetstr1/465236/TSEL_009939.t1
MAFATSCDEGAARPRSGHLQAERSGEQGVIFPPFAAASTLRVQRRGCIRVWASLALMAAMAALLFAPVVGANKARKGASRGKATDTACQTIGPGMATLKLSQAVSELSSHGRHQEAADCLARAAQASPDDAALAFALGQFLLDNGAANAAIGHLRAALRLAPDMPAEAHSTLGWALLEGGGGKAVEMEAMAALTAATQLREGQQPSSAQVADLHRLALLRADMDDLEGALAGLHAALRAGPPQASVLNSLGSLLRRTGALTDACEAFKAAVELDPTQSRVRYNLGVCLEDAGRLDAALKAFEAAWSTEPTFVEAALRVADLRRQAEPVPDWDGALAAADAAQQLRREWAKPEYVRGQVLSDAGRHHEAIGAYRAALSRAAAAGDLFWEAEAFFSALHLEQYTCQWDAHEARQHALPGLLRRELAQIGPGETPAVRPLQAISYLPADLLASVSASFASWAASTPPDLATQSAIRLGRRARAADWEAGTAGRIRLGYVSANFGDHAVGHLTSGLWARHDATAFLVSCYSLSPSDGSTWWSAAEAHCAHFVDVSGLSAAQAASRIASDGVDLLVDMMGYTRRSMPEIFALRPAAIQVAFMGWAASTHSSYIDYALVDRMVAPPSLAAKYFSEKLIYVASSYYVNSHRDTHSDVALPTETEREALRLSEGLPATRAGMVLACFNQHFKIDPHVFAIWTNILRRLPGSVLWLLDWGGHAVRNLQTELLAAGLSLSRLVVARVQPIQQHLQRAAAADLFLDTLTYGGHTTAVDALWMGVPVVSLPGEKNVHAGIVQPGRSVGLPGHGRS